MRAVFHSVFHQFWRTKIISAVLLVQVFICALVFINAFGFLQNHVWALGIAQRSFSDAPYVAWQYNDRNMMEFEYYAEYNEYVDACIAQGAENEAVEQVIPLSKRTPLYRFDLQDGGSLYNVQTIMYNNALLRAMDIPLSAGAFWDTARTYTVDEPIPVVVGSDLKADMPLGSVHHVAISRDQLSPLHDQSLRLELKVVGILNKRDLSFSFSTIAFSLKDNLLPQLNVLLMPELELERGKDIAYYDANGAFVKFKQDASGEDIRQFQEAANEKGQTARELTALRRQDKSAVFEALRIDLATFIIMFVVSLTGIGGNNGLVREYNEKDYGVYFIHGAKWKQCVWMDVLRNLLLVVPPGIIAIIIMFIRYANDPLQPYLLDGRTVLAVFVMLLLIYVISSLSFILHLRKTDPIDIVRRWE
ncbi:MAG: FtsX-like permease family protein [Christensenellales bacterium]